MALQVVVSADILVLNETVSFTREAELAGSASTAIVPVSIVRFCLFGQPLELGGPTVMHANCGGCR